MESRIVALSAHREGAVVMYYTNFRRPQIEGNISFFQKIASATLQKLIYWGETARH